MARVLGERGGYVMATLGEGYHTRPLHDADRFANLGMVTVAADFTRWRCVAPNRCG